MKQKHFWLILAIITVISLLLCVHPQAVHAQDTTKVTTSTVYHDIKSGIESASPKVSKAIAQLSRQLGVTVNKVWDILVKQQRVYAVEYLVVFLFTIFSWCHFWYRYKKGADAKWSADTFHEAPAIITFLIAFTGSGITICHFGAIFTGFMNPEYGAIRTIIEVASELK